MAVAVGLALTEHKTGRASASLLSRHVRSGEEFWRARVLPSNDIRTNLLSQVGLARNAASRVAMLLQSDKKQADKRSSAFES